MGVQITKADARAAAAPKPSAKRSQSRRDLDSRPAAVVLATVSRTAFVGGASNGYVTNVEGVLKRIQRAIESAKNNEDDPKAKKIAKNHLKKCQFAQGIDMSELSVESLSIRDNYVDGDLELHSLKSSDGIWIWGNRIRGDINLTNAQITGSGHGIGIH